MKNKIKKISFKLNEDSMEVKRIDEIFNNKITSTRVDAIRYLINLGYEQYEKIYNNVQVIPEQTFAPKYGIEPIKPIKQEVEQIKGQISLEEYEESQNQNKKEPIGISLTESKPNEDGTHNTKVQLKNYGIDSTITSSHEYKQAVEKHKAINNKNDKELEKCKKRFGITGKATGNCNDCENHEFLKGGCKCKRGKSVMHIKSCTNYTQNPLKLCLHYKSTKVIKNK